MTMDVSQHSANRLDLSRHSYTRSDNPPPVTHVYTTNSTNCDADMDRLSSWRENNIVREESSTEQETSASSRISALMIMSRRSLTESSSTIGLNYCEESRNRNISDVSLDISQRKKKSSNHRTALLEQTKNRSWSNLSGYNSSTGPLSLRKVKTSSSTNDNFGFVTNAERLSHCTSPIKRSLYPSSSDSNLRCDPGLPVSSFSTTDDPYDQYSQYARRNKRTYATNSQIERGTLQLQSANGEASKPFMHEVVTEPTSPSLDLENSNTIEGKSILVTSSRRDTKVAFSTIEVRQYERILGDNPGVSSGPPLSIGWNYYEDSTICLPVDEFEYYHGSCGDQSEMVLTRSERESILRDLGYHERDIAACIRKNYKLKKNRRQTVTNLPIMPVEEAVESAKKSLSRMLMLPKRKERSSSMRLYREWKNDEIGNFNDAASSEFEVGSSERRKSILKSAASSVTFFDDTVDHPPSGASSVQSLEQNLEKI